MFSVGIEALGKGQVKLEGPLAEAIGPAAIKEMIRNDLAEVLRANQAEIVVYTLQNDPCAVSLSILLKKPA